MSISLSSIGTGFRRGISLNELSERLNAISDVTPPNVLSFSPANGATGVAVDAPLVVTFSENVFLGTAGTVTIKKSSDDSTIYQWNVATSEGSGAGLLEILNGDELNLYPGLDNNEEYYVVWDEGVVIDLTGNPVASLVSTSTWAFTTVA